MRACHPSDDLSTPHLLSHRAILPLSRAKHGRSDDLCAVQNQAPDDEYIGMMSG